MGKKVILVYPVPEVGWNIPKYISKYQMYNPDKSFSPITGSTSYDIFKKRNQRSYNALDNIGKHKNLFRVLPENIFCNKDIKNRCIVQKNSDLYFTDDDHLSNTGAKLVVNKIIEKIK